MAKGRRLTISRSDRYFGTYAGHSYTNDESESPELREEDIWSMVEGGGAGIDNDYYEDGEAESEWETRAVSKSPPMQRRDRQVGGLTLAFEESAGRTTSSRIVHQLRPQDGFVVDAPPSRRQRQVASSAPVNVPDWKKILRVNSVESMNDSYEGEFENERDSAVDPPHEYLARSRKKDATSVFEGVGRTLKGRDMRRLRDTVWSQTGFDG